MTLKEFAALKDRAEQLSRDAERSKGAAEQIARQLASEFSCKSIEAAQKMLKRLQREATEAEVGADRAAQEFEWKWGDQLNDC